MAKTVKKKTVKKGVKKRKTRTSTKKENEPEYMIQIHDPKGTRKNTLESLREVIIFMQSYEKFKKIQEEKVITIAKLKSDINEINSLVNNRLKAYFPKGRLKNLVKEPAKEEPVKEVPVQEEPQPEEVVAPPPIRKTTELDELESQLNEIEGQLRTMN